MAIMCQAAGKVSEIPRRRKKARCHRLHRPRLCIASSTSMSVGRSRQLPPATHQRLKQPDNHNASPVNINVSVHYVINSSPRKSVALRWMGRVADSRDDVSFPRVVSDVLGLSINAGCHSSVASMWVPSIVTCCRLSSGHGG